MPEIHNIQNKTKELKKVFTDFFEQEEYILLMKSDLNEAIKRVGHAEIKNKELQLLIVDKDVPNLALSFNCPRLETVIDIGTLKNPQNNLIQTKDDTTIKAIVKNEHGLFIMSSSYDKIIAHKPMDIDIQCDFPDEKEWIGFRPTVTHTARISPVGNEHAELPNSQYLNDLIYLASEVVKNKKMNKGTEDMIPRKVNIDTGMII